VRKSVSWETLLKQNGLAGFQLRSALVTLFDAHVIAKEELETGYHLEDKKLGKEYTSYINDSNQNKSGENSESRKETLEEMLGLPLKKQKGLETNYLLLNH
jgi:hypothetical protein